MPSEEVSLAFFLVLTILLPMASNLSSSSSSSCLRRGPEPWPWTQLWPEGVILPSMTAQTSSVKSLVNSAE
nr:hypothetical protein [Trichoderma harzianum]